MNRRREGRPSLRAPGTSVSSYVQAAGVIFYKEGRKGILQETPPSFFRNLEVGLQLQNSLRIGEGRLSASSKSKISVTGDH
jgi:hypothetical protein